MTTTACSEACGIRKPGNPSSCPLRRLRILAPANWQRVLTLSSGSRHRREKTHRLVSQPSWSFRAPMRVLLKERKPDEEKHVALGRRCADGIHSPGSGLG